MDLRRKRKKILYREQSAWATFEKGMTTQEVAAHFEVSDRTARRWKAKYRQINQGTSATLSRGGRPRNLTHQEKTQLRRILTLGPKAAGFSRACWTPELVARVLRAHTGIYYGLTSVDRILEAIDFDL